MGAIRKAFIRRTRLSWCTRSEGEEKKAAATVEALERLAREVAKIKPSTIIVTNAACARIPGLYLHQSQGRPVRRFRKVWRSGSEG